MDESFSLQTPHLPSSAARLNHLLFEVMAVAVPQVAYSFVTKSCPALHTFARAGHRAGTRGETKSQMPRGSCVHEPAGIEGECLGHPVLLSWLRTSDGLAPLPVWPYGVPPVIMRPCRSSEVREGLPYCTYSIGGPVPKTGAIRPMRRRAIATMARCLPRVAAIRSNIAWRIGSPGSARQAVSTSTWRRRLTPWRLMWPRRIDAPEEYSLGVRPV